MTQPIGLTVLGGMTFGSMMTLFLMPVIYFIFNKKDEKRRLLELEAELKEPKKIESEVSTEERKSRGQKRIITALADRVSKTEEHDNEKN